MMKRVMFVCLLLGLVAFASSLETNAEDSEYIDLIVEKELKKVGEEAVLVGQILRECAKGLEVRVAENEHLANETVEYIFKKLWRGAKKAVKTAGKIIGKSGRRLLQTKAVHILKRLLQKKSVEYALAEDESCGSLVLALSKEMDTLGKALIERGVELCGACRRKRLEDAEKEFVKEFVSAF